MMTNSGHPRKVYVELSNRCNLQCSVCVKNTAGSCVSESNMDLAVFRERLVSLAGIGNRVPCGHCQ